ncbi:MORN-repeat protein [Orpheovirus IHUMI-LCC2]|uniref:MORN-repeat protein n=1 Tax=Orpheovirus IHUMI-LCC2 TaxID=2023057 RepID=A0A2I2L4M3_9VIRU|nr:MORN-repeat protein [Orpheovirus IHUMI-LCC2]SNW62461.1 MORN-repeat protein [Orpheovirus IHUMI-LCC2]
MMEQLSEDILFYNICYSDYEVSILFSSLCKRFNQISKGYGKELRTPTSFFLKRIEDVNNYGFKRTYWINKFTNKKEGKCEVWWDNGNKCKECYYKDGKKQRKYESWWKDGTRCTECYFINGNTEGKYIEWHQGKNGHIHKEYHYKNGKRDGKHEMWWENGNKRKQCFYVNGKREGVVECWHEDGNRNTLLEQYKNS